MRFVQVTLWFSYQCHGTNGWKSEWLPCKPFTWASLNDRSSRASCTQNIRRDWTEKDKRWQDQSVILFSGLGLWSLDFLDMNRDLLSNQRVSNNLTFPLRHNSKNIDSNLPWEMRVLFYNSMTYYRFILTMGVSHQSQRLALKPYYLSLLHYLSLLRLSANNLFSTSLKNNENPVDKHVRGRSEAPRVGQVLRWSTKGRPFQKRIYRPSYSFEWFIF